MFFGALCCCSCGTPHCPPGLSRCDDLCVDTAHSEQHCGGCYNTCLRPLQCSAGVCALPACSNGVRDSAETATDCGGPDCPHCQLGETCAQDSDCQSKHCNQAKKACSGGCEDGVKDGDEGDVDCGGSCPLACTVGQHCRVDTDCAQGICFGDGICRVEGFTLTADRTQFYLGETAVAHLTASYLADGEAVGNAPVVFNADFATGTFVDSNGVSLGQTVTGNTDPNGVARVDFAPAQVAGTSTLAATAHGNSATVGLTMVALQAPVWVSTRCDGGDCDRMGPAGDLYNEAAVVTFKVRDGQGMPSPGVPVAFTLPNGSYGATVDPAGTTDSNGLVSTTLHSGTLQGINYVWATLPGGQAGTSRFITVAGVKATNDEYSYRRFKCTEPNVAGFASLTPPAQASNACEAVVADRHGNAANTVTLHLLSEAGSVPPTATTNALGALTFTFSTSGPLPVDVTPLAALSSNGPVSHRDLEPSTDAGGNPRDGLVSLVAYGFGDEFLYDTNGNEVWDPGENFVDQGEPLVDANDDGVWTPGETFFDTNGNGVWDGPNGVWDRNTTVWVDTTFIYSGAATQLSFSPASYGVCPGGVAKGGTASLFLSATDDRLNSLSDAASYAVVHTASKGDLVNALGPPNSSTDYGFTNERLLAAPDGGNCSGPCELHHYFEYWNSASGGAVVIEGADAGDTSACENDTLTVTITVNGIQTQISTTGAIQ
ncbi:MAG: Ig-like domain-containing protein [Myxococcaceae bacterium]